MSDLERAVYELADIGALGPAQAPLYARSIGKLARAGLLRRREDGTFEAVRAATDKRPRPASVPPPALAGVPPLALKSPPMETLVCKIPAEWMDVLDAMGPNRSEAARVVLGRALKHASGESRMQASV